MDNINYNKIDKFINLSDYDVVISLGNKCLSAIALNKLNIRKEAFPFDFIPTYPEIILKYLKNHDDFFPKKNNIKNDDLVWFGHYNMNQKYEETKMKFTRRFDRLLNYLKSDKRILFVYTSEADMYNEFDNYNRDNFYFLKQIIEHIKITYNKHNFTILAIHTNKYYDDDKNIINYTVNVPNSFMSMNGSTHTSYYCNKYRDCICLMLRDIFKLQ